MKNKQTKRHGVALPQFTLQSTKDALEFWID